MEKPTYEQLEALTIDALKMVEDLGWAAGGVKNEVDELLKKHNMIDWFGSVKDKESVVDTVKKHEV